MRAPRIRVKTRKTSLRLKRKTRNTGCAICKNKTCVDDKTFSLYDRLTRSVSKFIKEIRDNKIIIYETYRCMPLLGDEKVQAPDWEEHIVKYHIVFVKN